MIARSNESKCLTPGCTGERKVRGLCHPCAASARRLVATRQTSWFELEQLGLTVPVTVPRISLLTRALMVARAAKTAEEIADIRREREAKSLARKAAAKGKTKGRA